MTPEEQRAEDVAWLERKARDAEEMGGLYRSSARSGSARLRRILAALSAQQEPPQFTDEHALGLGAVMDKLRRANGPVVLSWEEAEAVLDFAETALRLTGYVPTTPNAATPSPEPATSPPVGD